MAGEVNLDRARQAALNEVDRTERNYRALFAGAALLEAGFLATFLLLADLQNRMHVLLLLSTVAGYTLVILGLVALGMHVSANIRRVLNAIAVIGEGK